MKLRMKTIKQTVNFQAKPHDVFEALMDSKKHSSFTSSKASISRKVGGKIQAYDGYIEGKNLQIIKDKKIVQSWRGSGWPKGHFSKATFSLTKTKTGTCLTFTQTDVPDSDYKSISKGWYEHYWTPLKLYLEQ